jgi:hypothetical protein
VAWSTVIAIILPLCALTILESLTALPIAYIGSTIFFSPLL